MEPNESNNKYKKRYKTILYLYSIYTVVFMMSMVVTTALANDDWFVFPFLFIFAIITNLGLYMVVKKDNRGAKQLLRIWSIIRLCFIPIVGFMMLMPGFLYYDGGGSVPPLNGLFAWSTVTITPLVSILLIFYISKDLKTTNVIA
jgi:cytochrome bd-type quinol oxidase subunit 2